MYRPPAPLARYPFVVYHSGAHGPAAVIHLGPERRVLVIAPCDYFLREGWWSPRYRA